MMAELFDVTLAHQGGSSDERNIPEMSDGFGVASAEEDEKEYLDHMVKLFRDLSPEGQKFIKITLSAV